MLGRERHAEALDLVEGLLQSCPSSSELLCMRGNCLAATGNNVGVRCKSCFLPANLAL